MVEGLAGPLKKASNVFFFSGVSGGNTPLGAGLPSNQSGMKTWIGRSDLACAKMSAPCLICGLRPKMSMMMKMADLAEGSPVWSNGEFISREE